MPCRHPEDNERPRPVKAAEPPPSRKPLPRFWRPLPAKAADAKPVPVKTVVKPKDAIPGLRLSANAY